MSAHRAVCRLGRPGTDSAAELVRAAGRVLQVELRGLTMNELLVVLAGGPPRESEPHFCPESRSSQRVV